MIESLSRSALKRTMMHRQASAPVEPRFRGGKGRNQELNSRLRTKADELERLFTEHKLRAHREDRKDEASVAERSRNVTDFVRGELYERYAQKRDSKLRKERGAKREEREREVKAMRESLERSSAELKARDARIRRTTTTMTHRDRSVANNLHEEKERKFSDSSSKNVDSMAPPAKRSMSLSTGRNSNSSLNRAIPRPPSKAPIAGSVRASNPNQSEFRKQNTKPSIVAGKTTDSSIARSKSTSASVNVFNEDKPPTASTALPKELRPAAASDFSDHSYSGKASVPESRDSCSCAIEATVRVDAASPTGSRASGKSRKKWGSSVKGGKGMIRFLRFGRKTKGVESVASASEGCHGGDDSRFWAMTNSSSEYQPKDGTILLKQAQTCGLATIGSSANYRPKEDQSPRGSPRSFFSLPTFRNRGGESKLGR